MNQFRKFSMHVAICMNLSGLDMKREDMKTYLKAACNAFSITEAQIFGKSKDAKIVEARHIIIYLANTNDGYGLTEIGNFLNRDHSTISHAIKSINNRILTDHNNIKQKIEKVKQLL